MKRLFTGTFLCLFVINCKSQDLTTAATRFIATLDATQKAKALYPFDSGERYNFHFFPKDDRKGIAVNELSPAQRTAAMALVKTSLSERGATRSGQHQATGSCFKRAGKTCPRRSYTRHRQILFYHFRRTRRCYCLGLAA